MYPRHHPPHVGMTMALYTTRTTPIHTPVVTGLDDKRGQFYT